MAGLLNLGSTSFADDPYQVKVLRPLLEQQGLWNPAWDAWANDQSDSGESGGAPIATPDLSSLAGYGAGFGDYGGGNRYEALTKDGQEVAGNPYSYDEPALFQGQDLLQAAAIVGGGAYGMNAMFGGLGAAGAAGAAGGAAEGLGTLGTIEAGSGAVAALPTMAELGLGAMAAPTLPAVASIGGATGAAAAGGLLDKLTSNPRLVAGLAGGLLGGADAGGGGGSSYSGPMPTITRGGWSPTATPTYTQPAPQPLLNTQPGQANSGLWRFMGSGQ